MRRNREVESVQPATVGAPGPVRGKLLDSTASASFVGLVIGQNVISAIRVLQKRTNKDSALAGDPKSETRSKFFQSNGSKNTSARGGLSV